MGVGCQFGNVDGEGDLIKGWVAGAGISALGGALVIGRILTPLPGLFWCVRNPGLAPWATVLRPCRGFIYFTRRKRGGSRHCGFGAEAFIGGGFGFGFGFEKFADEGGPAGLVGGAQASAGVPVEVFVEEDQVAEVGVVDEAGFFAVAGAAAGVAGEE